MMTADSQCLLYVIQTVYCVQKQERLINLPKSYTDGFSKVVNILKIN